MFHTLFEIARVALGGCDQYHVSELVVATDTQSKFGEGQQVGLEYIFQVFVFCSFF